MHNFVIFSDSSCDAPQSLVDKLDLRIVPFYVSFDGETYMKENVDISVAEFYDTLRAKKVFPKTSLPSIQDYCDAFRPVLAAGRDILCFCLTSKFSGSYQSALNAKNLLREEFPDKTLLIMDSMAVTGKAAQLIRLAYDMKQQGCDIQTVYEQIDRIKNQGRIFLTVDTLEYLQRGGRIGKVSAFAGNLLDIKPVIIFEDGELVPFSKCRGRKKAVSELVRFFLEEIGGNKEAYTAAIVHSGCLGEARQLSHTLQAEHGVQMDDYIYELGTTIGSHIGETVIGITYIKKLEYIEKPV